MSTIPKTPGVLRSLDGLLRNAEARKRAREMAEEATRSFRKFIQLSWPIIEPARALIPNIAVDAMADHLQAVADGQIKKLLITVVPGIAKSIVCAVQFPAWMWAPGRNPGWRSTFASYSSDLSTRDSVRCRNLLQSVWYREIFQPDWSFATDQNVKSYFINSAMGHRFSTSVGGSGTGFRGDAIIADDLLKASDRNSEAALSSVIDWWTNEMFNRLNDMSRGAKVIVMQRLSERDLAGHVLREGGYEHLMVPMEYDPTRSRVTCIGWKDPRTEKGELLCPALFPREVVDLELKNDEARWQAQYQQQPTSAEGAILKPHNWNYWQPAGMGLPPVRVKMPDGTIQERYAVQLPSNFDMEFQSWDCAFKETKDSDYVVGFGISTRGAQRFIRESDRARRDLPGTITAIRRMTALMPGAHLKLIEDKANGSAVIQMLREEIPGMHPVNPTDSKVARAAAAAVEQQAGNWYLPHPLLAPWVGSPEVPTESGFLAEASVFPFADHDDWVDAWSMAVNELQRLHVGGEFGTSDKDIRTERVAVPERWPSVAGLSITWREVGAVWIGREPDTGRHVLYATYSAQGNDPGTHAKELLKHGEWMPVLMHAAVPGRDERDGYALISTYQKFGVPIYSTMDNTAAEMADMTEALRAGKLKVFGDLEEFWGQFRMFQRDEKGKLPDRNVGLVLAALVAWHGRDKARAKPQVTPPRTQYSTGPSGNSWMAS